MHAVMCSDLCMEQGQSGTQILNMLHLDGDTHMDLGSFCKGLNHLLQPFNKRKKNGSTSTYANSRPLRAWLPAAHVKRRCDSVAAV